MANLKAYRYILQPYTGRTSRHCCPACNQPHCFTRYLDSIIGELLPQEFGICDRAINCGYHLNPYRNGSAGTSYIQQILIEESAGRVPAIVRKVPLSSHAQILTIPQDVYAITLKESQYQFNNLAQLLKRHFGLGVADDLLQRFRLGTSSFWPGACVFWLIDEIGRVRGGQVVLYDETGHTVKKPHRHTSWIHTALSDAYKQQRKPIPDWLSTYAELGKKSPCLFGLPQLSSEPVWKPIAIVESAKTAIIATPYLPEFVWLATMGLSYLTVERLEPLRGRRIVLFPDTGALEVWKLKAAELNRQGFSVQVYEGLEQLATTDERQNGLDLADVFLREWPGYPPDWDS